MISSFEIKVSGIVQGVGFRYHTIRAAERYNVCGFVSNDRDGSVYIIAEGEEENVNEFLEWCRQGPPYSKVTKVEIEEKEFVGYSSFEVMT